MKSLKTLGIAAVAAAALIALVDTGTASATVLCKNNSSTTSCSENYGSGTEVKASLVSGTKSKLVTEVKTVECGKSSVAGNTSNAGSSTETVKGNVETLTFEECNCTVTVLNKGTLEVHHISSTDNGTTTSNGAEITASCSTIFGTVHCIYATSNTDLGTLTGGNPAKLSVNAQVPRLTTSALCSEKATWTAEYEVTSPKPLYVAGASAPTETALSTSLSGEEKSGEEITVNEGSPVNDSATLSGANASKATGTVTYKVYADKECKELVTSAGEVTVSEGNVPASEEKELEAGRVYYWLAEYSGDSNNLKSTSTCGKEVLTVKAATSVSTILTAGEESSEMLELEEEAAVTDTATLSGTNAATAGGSVKYSVYSDPECEELVTEAGEVTVSEGKAPASEGKTLEPGIYFWQAKYGGDTTHSPSTSECGAVIEQVATPTVTLHDEKATGAALAANSEVKGESGSLVFETPAKDLIECEKTEFVGKVLQNSKMRAEIGLTSWEFKKGGAEGERCKTSMKKGVKPVDVVITPLMNGTLQLWKAMVNGGGEIQTVEVKMEFFVEKTRELTCRYGSAAVPTNFVFNAGLGLNLAAVNKRKLVRKVGSEKNCWFELGLSGGVTVTTKPGGKAVVPTTP